MYLRVFKCDTHTHTQCEQVQRLVIYSAPLAEALSLSPSVGTLLYWQPGATSTAGLAGSGSVEGWPCFDDFLSLLSSQQNDTMRNTADEATTALQAKKTWKYWPVLSTRIPARNEREKSSVMLVLSVWVTLYFGSSIFPCNLLERKWTEALRKRHIHLVVIISKN